MDKLPPWRERIARAAVACLLAWTFLVGPASAGASSARSMFAGAALSATSVNCAAGGDDHRPSHHGPSPCVCCATCRPTSLDPLAAALPAPTGGAAPLLATLRIDRAGAGSRIGASPPLGWISSWSQRAPPGRASVVSPLPAFSA